MQMADLNFIAEETQQLPLVCCACPFKQTCRARRQNLQAHANGQHWQETRVQSRQNSKRHALVPQHPGPAIQV